MPNQNFALGNIIRVVPVDLSQGDFEDNNGFFIRVETAGALRYCPKNNEDSEAITKQFDASNIFIDPELCRKIFASGASPEADLIYVGYGV
jgi:hypothetical protein